MYANSSAFYFCSICAAASMSLKGATLQQLISHAGALNFSNCPLRLDIGELANWRCPIPFNTAK
jgi:hypothetical protein